MCSGKARNNLSAFSIIYWLKTKSTLIKGEKTKMKKNFWKTSKKALSVFLSVLMIMSCWVFVAPELNSASAADAATNYNNTLISGITDKTFNTVLTTVYGKFTVDVSAAVEGNYTDSQRAQVYRNLLYSPTVTNNTTSDPCALRWNNVTLYKSGNYIRYYFPNTVMVYDGSTVPSTPVVMAIKSDTANYITPYSGYIATNNGITLQNNQWYGIGSSSNVEAPQFLQAYFAKTVNGPAAFSTSDSTYRYRHGKSNAYFWTNVLQFSGTLGANEYYRAVKPDLCWQGGNNYAEGYKTLTASGSADGGSNKTIYVLKYDTLKTAIDNAKTTYNTITSNPGRYTPASVKKYVELANALLAARPGNYINSSTAESSLATQASAYATAAKNAVTAWNNWSGLEDRTYDITYENLFSFSDWVNSKSSSAISNGTLTYDVAAGKITMVNSRTGATEEVTTASSSSRTSTARDTAYYSIPVTGGKQYTLDAKRSGSTDIYLFWYDASGYTVGTFGADYLNETESKEVFTAPTNATCVELRFDNDAGGSTVTFEDIAFYETDRATEIGLDAWTTRPIRTVYNYGATFNLSGLTTPVRPGYTFDGWYLDAAYATPYSNFDGSYTFTTANSAASFPAYAKWTATDYTLTFNGNGGTAAQDSLDYNIEDTITMPNATRDAYAFDYWKVTVADGNWASDETYNVNQSVSGKYGNATLAAQWTKLHTVTFLNGDGSVLATAKVKNGEAATAPQATPTKASDANYSYTFSSWKEDFSNVTGDMTVNPDFTTKEHTVAYDFVSDRTCEKNAMVNKYCETCHYSFFDNQEYDGTEIAEYIKLNHDYVENDIVAGSSTGNTDADTHEIKCVRYRTCGSTQAVVHTWIEGTTDDADCVTPGTVNWSCPCGAKKTTTGSTAPDVHNDTKTINAKDATCTVDGYTGDTYCNDCQKTVETGETINKLGHSFTNYTSDSNATCFADGTKTAKCDRCDATDTLTETGSQLTHSYTDYVYNNDAKCEVNGTETATCDHGCGTEDTRTAEDTALSHTFNGTIKNNGNGTHSYLCTTKDDCGVYGGTVDCASWKENETEGMCQCEDCGYTKVHAWGEWVQADDNTTLAKGKMNRTCEDCGAIDTTDCTYVEESHSDATCTSPERTTYTCNDCGHGYTVIGEAAQGHKFDGKFKSYNNGTHAYLCSNGCGNYGFDGIVDAKESCTYEYTNTASGTHTATCEVCAYSFSEDCEGGEATCTAEAVCEKCTTAYGTKADHSFNGDAVKLDGDVHAYLCEYCGETTGIYGIGNEVNETEACEGGTATCSALAVCTVCLDTHGELDADAHKWGKAVTDAANAGKHIYTCEYDESHTKSEDCESGSSEVVAPKCEEDGYTIQTCKECSYKWNTDYVDATGHNWVDPVNNEDGTHTLTCDNKNADGWVCDKTLTLDCAESAITFGLEPATCTEQGYTTYQCTVCTYTWNADYVDATGHSYAKKLRSLDAAYKRSDKTCTEAETYWYRCDNCTVSAGTEEDKYADNLASIYWANGSEAGHDMQKLVDENDLSKNRVSEATCTAAAVYNYSCSVCGDKDDTQTFTYKAALGHDYQELVDEDNLEKNRVSEATCTSPAIYNKSCSRCGDVSKDTFEYGEKIGHKMTKTEAKAATCTDDGNVEYYTCGNCSKIFSDEEGTKVITKTVIDALGHDWVKVEYKAPTCEQAGHSEYKDCSRCDAISGKTDYEATGHKFTGAYFCDTTNNYHAKYCVNDGCTSYGIGTGEDAVKYSVELDGVDFVIKGGEKCEFTSSEFDTDENGIHSHKLTCVCGNVTSKAYSDDDTFVETVASTCTVDGYDLYECPDCGETWQKNVVTALGHDLAEKATSNGDGTHSVKCSKCDYEADAEKCSGGTATCKDKAICDACEEAYGETTDHTYDEAKWVYQNDATCTKDGTEKNNCITCGNEATRTAEDTATGHSVIADYVYDISAWKHKPADFEEEIKAPTCGSEGLAIIYCENCSYYKTKSVAKDSTAHVWETDENGEEIWAAISGDCATGITKVCRCTVEGCGKIKSVTEEVPHTWVEIVRVEADCEHDGYSHFKCSVCGFVQVFNASYEGYPVFNSEDTGHTKALGHSWEREGSTQEIIEDKKPTCGLDGRGYYVCTVCKEKSDSVVIPRTGHMWDEDGDGFTDAGYTPDLNESGYNPHYIYVEAEEATCINFGHDGYYKCSDCSYDQHLDERWISHYSALYPMKAHQDNDGDNKCDECKSNINQESEVEKDENGCDCICHKESWFMQLIYKIIRFFWKLFKIGKSCECGAVHY